MIKNHYHIALSIMLLLICISSSVHAQSWRKKNFSRESNLALQIDKVDSFQLNLQQFDVLRFQMTSKRSINIQIKDPKGRAVFAGMSNTNQSVDWTTAIDSSGLYLVKLKTGLPLLSANVDIAIQLERKSFELPRADSVVYRNVKQLMNSSLKLPRTKKGESFTNTFSYLLNKGDSLYFKMIPLFGDTPFVRVTSQDNEVLFAERPNKESVETYIVALDTSAININLTSRSFLPKTDSLIITRIMPPKKAKPQPNVIEVIKENIFFDSIPEVYLDTAIYLGAVRDYINESIDSLTIDFEGDTTISFWSIMYGAGQEYLNKLDYLSETLESSETVTNPDLLAAFGLGQIKKLPNQGNREILFRPSSELRKHLKYPVRNNYATIKDSNSAFKLTFENKSLSVGRNVYVKVIVFRKDYELLTEQVEQ